MSLENHTTTGNILPIGLLVCSHCKEKHLKGIDFTNSQLVGGAESVEDQPTDSKSVDDPKNLIIKHTEKDNSSKGDYTEMIGY